MSAFGIASSVVLVVCVTGAACSKSTPAPPAMTPTAPVTVTGREQLGWDQLAANATELSTIGYTIYVDSAPSRLNGVDCSTTGTGPSFPCQAPLPAMSIGSHTLGLAAFYDDSPAAESSQAGPLQIIVTGTSTGSSTPSRKRSTGPVTTLRDTASVPAAEPWPSSAVRVADGLDRPADLAFTPDARLWVAERSGRIRVLRDGALADTSALTPADGPSEIVALAIDPKFDRTHFVYATYAARSRSGTRTFTLARFREVADTLADRIVILDDVPASADAHASLRFGADDKLYAAFDDGGDRRLIGDLASFNGKILRLNPDGTTPDDSARKSPVFMTGLASPRGLAWHRSSGRLWAADTSRVGLVQWANPASIATFRDDLFVGSDTGLVRSRIDQTNPARLAGTTELLRNVPVRAVAASPDGAIYFATPTAVGRLQ